MIHNRIGVEITLDRRAKLGPKMGMMTALMMMMMMMMRMNGSGLLKHQVRRKIAVLERNPLRMQLRLEALHSPNRTADIAGWPEWSIRGGEECRQR